MTFIIFPAIDLRAGQVVRLKEGDPNRQTNYSPDPAQVARRWIAAGASWLHVVNLDGAFDQPIWPTAAPLKPFWPKAWAAGSNPVWRRAALDRSHRECPGIRG